jgi:exopolysaccharide biosynthesis polyprenyl glycosylphosphotransferase
MMSLSLQITERKTLLVLGDVLLLNLAVLAGLWLGAERSGWPFSAVFVMEKFYWFVGLTALYLLLAAANDAHSPRITSDLATSFLALGITIGEMLLVYLVIYFVSSPASLPRHVIGFFSLISTVLLLVWRWVYSVVFTSPVFQRRVIIVGAGWAGQTIAHLIRENLASYFAIAGYVDDDPVKQATRIEGLPVLGRSDDLCRLVAEVGATDLVLAITHDVRGDLLRAIMTCHEQGVRVLSMQLLYEQLARRIPVEHVGNNWFVVLPMDQNGGQRAHRAVKRLADVIIAIVGLLLLAVILPILVLVIKLDSPGPIFYRQQRAGRAGRPFQLVKLRSMVVDAEKDGQARWADPDDERVTRVGRFLRSSRLDEVPQLFNVLKGDMSLIGPRPERPEFIAQLQEGIPFYRTRLAVRPGLTGWAQVNYPYANSVQDALVKLQYDLYYIKHQSLYLDLVILLKTIGVVLTMQGT